MAVRKKKLSNPLVLRKFKMPLFIGFNITTPKQGIVDICNKHIKEKPLYITTGDQHRMNTTDVSMYSTPDPSEVIGEVVKTELINGVVIGTMKVTNKTVHSVLSKAANPNYNVLCARTFKSNDWSGSHLKSVICFDVADGTRYLLLDAIEVTMLANKKNRKPEI